MPGKPTLLHILMWTICLSLCEMMLNAQEVTHFSIEEGLSQTWVRCIHQDSRGYLWIGTQDGLNRYDGYDFKFFRQELYDTNSIGGNTINSISEDREGNLWIGTENGLSKLDPGEGTFQNFYPDSSNINSLSSVPVYQTIHNSSGEVWVRSPQYLNLLDSESGTIIKQVDIERIPYSPPIDYILPMLQDRNGYLWIGTNEGLFHYIPESDIMKKFVHDPASHGSIDGNSILSIHEDQDGTLWFGTPNCLNKFDSMDATFERFYLPRETDEDILVYGLYNDPTGLFWIGTNAGIFHFNEDTRQFTYFEEGFPKNLISGYFSIITFIKDRSEIIWAGGSNGLYKYDQKRKKFNLYANQSPEDPDFSGSGITAIYEKPGEYTWLGTWGAGLVIYDRDTRSVVRSYKESSPARSKISDDIISSIIEDREGLIWVGTERGVNVFDKTEKKFISFPEYSRIPGSDYFDQMYVNHIFEDHDGNIWFATADGWIKYDKSIRKVKSFLHDPDNANSLSSSFVYITLQDTNQIFWIGTRNGLNRYDPERNDFTVFRNESVGIPSGISNNYVYSLIEDKNGYLWIGTGSGLNRLNRETGEFEIFTEKSGFPNDLIYAILEDDHENLWISTNRGLVKFNTRTENVYTFDTSDGLQSLEFNIGAYFKSKNGEFFFGGVDGFNSFFPDSIAINPYPPNLVITSFECLSENGWEEIPFEGRTVNIKSREANMFAVEFAALEYTNPQKNQYQFYLEGLEDTWQPRTFNRRAVYSNLDAGNYVLHVRGTNNDLVWNDEEISIQINVKSGFWNSHVAKGIYVVSLILLIYLYIQNRTSSLIKANRILQDKQKVSEEIERQKEELSIKNKNITDSINYAKKIQEALLPSPVYFRKLLPESFVFYQPKDIVSGDFYWINERKDKVYVTAVDCTGHGVPGAFMSLIGFEMLDKIINDQGIEQPAEILDILSGFIEEIFSKGEEDITLKDGMDIAFCVIDKKQEVLQFAGAFNPLYLLRDNTLTEIKGDRMSVGIMEGTDKNKFTNHVIPLEKEDVIYMFSDGYADQFGGPNGKKFMYRRFRHLLLTVHRLKMKDQMTFLEDSIKGWMGSIDQIDDILIIGIKPLARAEKKKSG